MTQPAQTNTNGSNSRFAFFKNFFQPGNNTLGYLLIIMSAITWFEGKNLRSMNIFLLIIVVFWVFVKILEKTNLFTNQKDGFRKPNKRRKLKLLSLILVFLLISVFFATIIVVNYAEDFGGDPSNHNSPNYKDGMFENTEQTDLQSEDVSSWDLFTDYLVSDDCRSPNQDLPAQKFESLEVEPGQISVSWFGHSTILMESSSLTIITDPVFSDSGAGPLSIGPQPFPYEQSYEIEDLPTIDYVFISHDHYDHLDMDTVKKLKNSEFFVPLGIKNHLLEWGVDEENIIELDWYDEIEVSNELDIVFTPSRHFSGRGFGDSHATLWGSWVFNFHNSSIYFSGDTGYMDEFKNISQLYGPFDLAFLDSGQYNLAWRQVHMLPEEVVQAGIDLNASVILPIHISKYELALHHWFEPLEMVSKLGLERNLSVATPMLGSSFILGEEVPQDPWWRDVWECSGPFLDDYPMIEYALFYTGSIGGFWIAIPMFAKNKFKEEE